MKYFFSCAFVWRNGVCVRIVFWAFRDACAALMGLLLLGQRAGGLGGWSGADLEEG